MIYDNKKDAHIDDFTQSASRISKVKSSGDFRKSINASEFEEIKDLEIIKCRYPIHRENS